MVDKKFCMSSYLAFRYIEKDDVDFFEGLHHKNIPGICEHDKICVANSVEIDQAIRKVFDNLKGEKLGILLSGGMDSACLASYMRGMDAYTFRFLGGEFQKEELARAEYYAKQYDMNLHYVDVSWDSIEPCVAPVIKEKNAPVHSIEPQLYKAALQAKADGIERLVVGESADLIFGGMDQLLSQDWNFEGFMKRYIFTEPHLVLKEPVDMSYLFERYRKGDQIDFMNFMDDVFSIESSSSYWNAFAAADIPYIDPYAHLKMAEPLDLKRVRNGESKYLIRDLFKMKYPDYPVPEKVPMPRPVDEYFENWVGPTRDEFLNELDMKQFTGNQKWQIWCLEFFLNMHEVKGR